MDVAQHQDGLARGPTLGDHRQQIQGDVGVAAQAQAIGILRITGDELRDQIQAIGVDVAGGVAVIAADVVLLGRRAVEQAARLHEELLDVDVVREAVAVQVGEVVQLNVVAKHPLDERFEKLPLQPFAQRRAAKAEGGVNRQSAFGQLPDALVERVDEAIGLAQTQR